MFKKKPELKVKDCELKTGHCWLGTKENYANRTKAFENLGVYDNIQETCKHCGLVRDLVWVYSEVARQ